MAQRGTTTPLLLIDQDRHVSQYLHVSPDGDTKTAKNIVRPACKCGLSEIQVVLDLPPTNTPHVTDSPAHHDLPEMDSKATALTDTADTVDHPLHDDVPEVDDDAALNKAEEELGPADTVTGDGEEDLFEEDGKRASDTLSESSNEEEDDSIDSDELRGDWEPLNAIPEQAFRLALLDHLPADHAINTSSICCLEAIEDGNNFVRILEVESGPTTDRYVIKVPCVGTAARWMDSDAYMLRNDARTMLYIRKYTEIPCPEVIGFDDSLRNTLGAPYIIMRANKGISSNKI